MEAKDSGEKEGPYSPANRGKGRWLVATYQPVSLFSLRMTHATSKGGKTLVVPTPYAVKMALLDACFRRWEGGDAEREARRIFETVKGREVRVRPPADCVVQNTFIKILDDNRGGELPFKNTIAYREFVYFRGQMEVALASAELEQPALDELIALFRHIGTFGKRGSFWQFENCRFDDGELGDGFTVPMDEESWRVSDAFGMVQALDDFGLALCKAKDGFDRISTFGDGTVKLGEHRVLVNTAIPYRRRSAGRGFTWYQRVSK